MKTPNKITNGEQVTRILTQNNISVRNCNGSHRVATLPNGTTITYHTHGDYGAGMSCKITKLLKIAGLLGVLLITISQIGI